MQTVGLCIAVQPGQRILRQLRTTKKETLESEQSLGDSPAFVDVADQIVLRHLNIIKEDFTKFLVPCDIFNWSDSDAGGFQINQQETYALLLAFNLRFGTRQHEYVCCILRQRGPDLLTIDDPVIASVVSLCA